MEKLYEKLYPYIYSLLVVFLSIKHKNSLYKSENINSALDALITASSLIIGFLGAVLPIILSMKNDSMLVKHVFQKDTDKLFLKYIKQTLITGIFVIILAVSVYFRDQFGGTWYEKYCVSILAYIFSCFLLCAFRCLNNILDIIFLDDEQQQKKREQFLKKDDKEKQFEKSHTVKENEEI